MHGTVEWLPVNPLGNTPESWPDILIGDIPNLYIYAANNPSESILAKRRGYATVISHNVPPYSRAGLYNELKQLKELISEFKSLSTTTSYSASDGVDISTTMTTETVDSSTNDSSDNDNDAIEGLTMIMIALLEKSGLFNDLPFQITSTRANLKELDIYSYDSTINTNYGGDTSMNNTILSSEKVQILLNTKQSKSKDIFLQEFSLYVTRLNGYLMELEQKLFSEGLYEIGGVATVAQIQGYLSALINETKLPSSSSLSSSVDSLHHIAHSVAESKPASSILIQLLSDPTVTGSLLTHIISLYRHYSFYC